MGIKNIMEVKYGILSGGQKRIVDIFRGLINNPSILFLDEPTTGLDIETRIKIWHLLNKLIKKNGLTIVLTTHYLEEVNQADKILIIDKGQILEEGSAKEIISKYTSNYLIIESNDYEYFILHFDGEFQENNKVKIPIKNFYYAIRILKNNENKISYFEYCKGTMNDAFINLTGSQVNL